MHPLRLTFALLLLAGFVPAQAPVLALAGNDPVDLCAGRVVPGRPELTADHFTYHYRFASADNRAAFLGDPARYGIQLDGGCARMGPLSGRGDPTRWHVHEQHIYIFASDGCRAGFMAAPVRFLPPAGPELIDATAALAAGHRALLRARAALGSPERLGRWQSLRARRTWTTATDDGPREDMWQRTLRADGRLRIDQAWGDHRYGTVLAEDAFSVGNDGQVLAHGPAGRLELTAQLRREPLALLHWLDGGAVQAALVGQEQLGERRVDVVHVRAENIATCLCIASDDGAVLQQRFAGRGPDLSFGDVVLDYDDFVDCDGVRLPRTVTTTFAGEVVHRRTFELSLDVPLDAALFRRPPD